MNSATLAARNVTRNKLRVTLTIAGIGLALLIYLLIRTVIWATTYSAEAGAKDRVATRHKVSFMLQLPRNYADKVRAVPGVAAATWMNWFGGKDPKDEENFFATLAVDHHSFLDVFTEVVVAPDVAQKWKADPQGVLIGDVLAAKMKVKAGDTVTLKGTIYPGDWQFHISGIYDITAKSFDRSQFIFHWEYLNNALPEKQRDQIGWMLARIDDPTKSADISKAIDKMFDDMDLQTLTMSERALNNSFIAMFDAILTALKVVSWVILIIMMLILGNTIAMAVRERTSEYGVLRAIGFLPEHIGGFILAEGLFIGFLGGLVGLGFGWLVVSAFRTVVEEGPMAAFFPYFRLQLWDVLKAFGASLLLGVIASLIPAYRASRLSVVNALRKVG